MATLGRADVKLFAGRSVSSRGGIMQSANRPNRAKDLPENVTVLLRLRAFSNVLDS
jgi:hypothetical protein